MPATRGELFAGVTVAIVTPFKNGEVDWDALGKLVDWHCEQKTDALAPCGTTGESPTLTHDENERVVAFVCERAGGRLKVMAGTGSNSTAEAVRMTKAAKAAGANGTLQVGPYYNKPTQDGYFRHFGAIAEATDLPIVVYNIPGRTASNILPETLARLAEAYPTVVAVKEATGSLDQASQIAALSDLTILSGDDSLTLPLMSIGGRGVVSVVGNIVPGDMMALVRAYLGGRFEDALKWHRKLFPLCRDMLGVATNPIPLKTAM
ncbi:MAG: 4-hydroxy-tetrahydrodipicolinate synthase, partial [Gemmataceae bacterium]|nr:4-hydroxy-tetrahydrodipicolinate synthase [Gemmataceae bacterium]